MEEGFTSISHFLMLAQEGGPLFLESLRYGFDDLRPYSGLAQYWHLLGQSIAQFTLVLLNG